MIRATAKASLTGITRLRRSSIEGVQGIQSIREILSVAVGIRADRTFLGEVAIAGALTGVVRLAIVGALTAEAVVGNQGFRTGVDVIALLVEVSEAVKRGKAAAGVVQAVEVCPQEGAVVREAEDPAAAGLVAAAVEADDSWI